MDDELEAMVRIDFPAYLAREGFVVDEKESTRQSFKLRNGVEVLVLRRNQSGVWQYFNTGDDRDNGTIIQYIQRRSSFNLGQVRKLLRPWLSGKVAPATAASHPAQPEFPLLDLAEMRQRWASAAPLGEGASYLATRGLTTATAARFRDTIRVDRSGNLLFAHTDDAGELTGYEIKGPTFSGFAKGGKRSLARFGPGDEVCQVVLTESGIDALSFHQLGGNLPGVLVVSTGGAVSPVTLDLVAALAARFPAAEVLVGFDADPPGERMRSRLLAYLGSREAVRVVIPSAGKDWNDALQPRQKAAECGSYIPRLGW